MISPMPCRRWQADAVLLPAYLTPIHGRAAEIRRVLEWLTLERLVTAAGPGGIGKTRLMSEVVAALSREGRRVDVVTAADLDSGAALVDALEAVLGHRLEDEVDELLGGETPHLILLDNLEHLLPGAVTVVDRILRIDGVQVLVTSRVPLGIPGEVVLWVEPLAVPPISEAPEQALAYASVALLASLVERTRPSRVAPVDPSTLVEVARAVDGMPLALELVATRVVALGGPVVARLLRESSVLLAHAVDGVIPRHRSVGEVVEWSMRLLTPQLQMAARLASLLVGGGDEAMFAALWHVEEAEAAVTISDLVNCSLLIVDGGGRFRMLEPIRQHVAGSLDAEQVNHGLAGVLDRCALLARDVEAADGRGEAGAARAQFVDELGNAFSAARWAIDQPSALITGAELVEIAFLVVYGGSAHASELADLFDRYADCGTLPPALLCRIARRGAFVHDQLGHRARADALVETSLAAARQAGDATSLVMAAQGAASAALDRGDLDRANTMLDAAEAADQRDVPAWVRCAVLADRATVSRFVGDFASAQRAWDEVRLVSRSAGDDGLWWDMGHAVALLWAGRWDEASAASSLVIEWSERHGSDEVVDDALWVATSTALAVGDTGSARRLIGQFRAADGSTPEFTADYCRLRALLALADRDIAEASSASLRAVAAADVLGHFENRVLALATAGLVALVADDPAAGDHLRAAVHLASAFPHVVALADAVEGLVIEAERSRAHDRRRTLAGVARHLRAATRRWPSHPFAADLARLVDRVRPTPGEFVGGSFRLTPDALAHALAPATAPGTRRRTTFGWDSLTPAEWAVADLVAVGTRNRGIAQQLGISVRTVDAHLAHVFVKLGVSNRTELSSALGRLTR